MQTYARLGEPFSSTRTRWRFGLKRRFVATIECDRLWPNDGFFPQMEQTLDTAGQCSRWCPGVYARAVARSRANTSAISSALRTASAARWIRASACSTFSTVSRPNATGTPVSIAAS